MNIAALIALLPVLIQGAGEVASIVQEMQASGASQTDSQQDERLANALSSRKIADQGYDALPSA